MYKVIDLKTYPKRKQYNWFSTFSNPCYGIDVEIDVTKLVKYSKETKTSFFVNFLYLVTKSMNCIDELRLRVEENEIRLYDVINPSFTVMTNSGVFENASVEWNDNFNDFYKNTKEIIEKIKVQEKVKDEYNSERYNYYYMTCLPWLDYKSMTHPIPSGNVVSYSVPRVCWGKYTLKEDKYSLVLNITVSHALVDGYPLSQAFLLIQENVNKLNF